MIILALPREWGWFEQKIHMYNVNTYLLTYLGT